MSVRNLIVTQKGLEITAAFKKKTKSNIEIQTMNGNKFTQSKDFVFIWY